MLFHAHTLAAILLVSTCVALTPGRADGMSGRCQQSTSFRGGGGAAAATEALSPRPVTLSKLSSSAVCRRSALTGILFFAGVPTMALAADANGEDDAAAQKAAAAERMKQKIAASKQNYRKPTDLVKDRKANTDYSCVSATGSPCVEEVTKEDPSGSSNSPLN